MVPEPSSARTGLRCSLFSAGFKLEMALLADSYCSHKATDCSIVWLCGDVYPSVICVSANSRPAVFGIEFKLPKKGFQTDQ